MCTPGQLGTEAQLRLHFRPPQLNKTRADIWRSAHLGNTTATVAKLKGKLETLLRSNSACQFPEFTSRVVVQPTI
jgi:hypothetical protein